MPRKKAVEEIYQKKSPREHVLLRPDTYVGSVQRDKEKMFVFDEATSTMKEEEIEYVPALYKIFDEILVNAADNKQRDQSMKKIEVKIDMVRGSIMIKNDGRGIPIEMHSEHNMYIPELIFGNLLTSSNYNDKDLKTVGGRNGYGAKLANIFSTRFVVETVDTQQSEGPLKYKQVWTDNMSEKEEPIIDELSRAKDYTKVTFYPDFQRFGMESLEKEDIMKLFIKRVYDIAGTTPKDLSVHLTVNGGENNSKYDEYRGQALKVKTFIDYTKLYIGDNARLRTDYWPFADEENGKWEVIFAISTDNEYRQISHVNNIWTIKGGTHVKYIENQFIKYFKENFKDKQKKIKEMLKPKMIREHLFVFINSLIVNPAFSSQTKEILTTKTSDFGSKCQIPDKINKSLMNKIKGIVKEFLNFKLDQAGKKTDGGKRKKINLPPEVDDANDAGKKEAADCTLIVTEGLSAKTLAVAGITELPLANNRWGIFPLKGKLLNVRDAPRSQINRNAEISNLKIALGLKHKEKYDTIKKVKDLRYGKVLIMTDQDYDGSHIKGLMINLFHSEWPELLQNKLFGPNHDESFVEQFITPIVVATKGKTQRKSFFTVPQYEQWKKENNNGKGWKIKYYKGLGTWQRKEGKEHFRNLNRHKIAFDYRKDENSNPAQENEDDAAIKKAFSKDHADLRKEWIAGYDKDSTYLDFDRMGINGRNKRVSYKDFIDKELILFSVNDLHRSIPSICDGLKPGQRKILYCCFLKNNLKREIRVAQLGGYVSEKSAYHHGETSLYQTIIGMAQDYVGSNNINLLSPNGMFGSRIRGGKDAASPRYIHTNLAPITRRIFVNDDDMILEYQDDDGYPVEPVYYMPIIPMVLVNGASGIGTGWSTNIPNYNPSDIVKNIRRKLSGEEWRKIHPFYRGFKGDIVWQHDNNHNNSNSNNGSPSPSLSYDAYKTHGIAEIINTFTDGNNNRFSTIQVTELPVQHWTENYKKFLLDLVEAEQIQNVNNMSSDIDVAFTFDVQHKIRPTRSSRAVQRNQSNSNSNSPQRTDNNKKTTKKKIYFNGTLDTQFLKDMKLISSMSCSNMVLFDADGKVKKYHDITEILDEFYDARLKAYSLRKKALLKSMEHHLLKITNQAKFILMIINDELIIAKRRRLDIIKDLRDNGFDVWIATDNDGTNTLRNRAKATDAFANDNDEKDEKDKKQKMDMDTDSDLEMDDNEDKELEALSKGYGYLLKMPLSSLTKERVEKLLKEQDETIKSVNALKQKSVKDLWRNDLDELEIELKKYDETYEENVEKMRKEAKLKREKVNKNIKTTKGRKTTKGKRKTTKTTKTTKSTKTTKAIKTIKTKSESTSSSQSSISKGMKKLTTTTNSKKKKKKLLSSTSSNGIKDPFSFTKQNAAKKAKKAEKTKPAKKTSMDYDEDEDSDQSPSAHLSLFERANIRRNSPQKNGSNGRKRKRPLLSDDDDDDDDDEYKPQRKKTRIAQKTKKQKNTMILSSDEDEEDEEEDEESENSSEYKPATKSLSRSRSTSQSVSSSNGKRKKSPRRNKAKFEESDDDDNDFDIDENNTPNTKHVFRRKKREDTDSEYQMSEEDDLEISEYSDY